MAEETLPASSLVVDLEDRQDQILRQLDDLNARLERALADYQRQFRVVHAADAA